MTERDIPPDYFWRQAILDEWRARGLGDGFDFLLAVCARLKPLHEELVGPPAGDSGHD